MTVYLKDIWPIEKIAKTATIKDFKIHFARFNGKDQPLNVWVRDKKEWQGWQEYRPVRDEFNRDYILSLMQFYHENNTWLFGGIFKVLKRHEGKNARYEVELMEHCKEFIGRLKIRSPYNERAARVNMENHYLYEDFEVKEILAEPYTGRSFPGLEKINLSFKKLEALIKNERSDWKAALENVKGIYLLTDEKSGKRYVGSAYGETGVWSRWRAYIETGHGNNVDLKKLFKDNNEYQELTKNDDVYKEIKKHDLDYCNKNFHFALLEYYFPNTPNENILARESYWKKVLFTRDEASGFNRN